MFYILMFLLLVLIIIIFIINIFFISFLFFDIFNPVFFSPSEKGLIKDFFNNFKFEKGKKFFDLGSGDGRIVFLAEEKGLEAYGVEKNPALFFLSLFYKKIKRSKAKFILKDFRNINLEEADYIYLYLLPKFLRNFTPELLNKLKKGTTIISFKFPLPDKSPDEVYFNKFYIYKI